MKRLILLLLVLTTMLAQAWQQVNENAPEPAREFRAVWVTTVFNLDWPSKAGLSAEQQKKEMLAILNTAVKLRFNAIILQVRPNADAIYKSSLEPWSCWLSGAGVDPGYDPLAFTIAEAHKRGLEVHAWFNPFRATISGKSVGKNHVSRRYPKWLKKAGSTQILNPSDKNAQEHVLKVILDVVKRYDIDGVHLDDYFYPYPPHNDINDGKTPSQRRDAIDTFVYNLYKKVKATKPWVRVGISPFGIWQPGYPSGVEAGVNAYEHLACDARKWLKKGWVDYLAPQLYWRIEGPQSFTALMQWWANINTSRPVWPGIASVRINSSEDPGRPASEIGAQMDASRKLARQSCGQIFWSWRSIATNRGGVQKEIAKRYTGFSLPPAMTWCKDSIPGRPAATAAEGGGKVVISWQAPDKLARKWVIQAGTSRGWYTVCVLPGGQRKITLPASFFKGASRMAVRPISACGQAGTPAVLAR
ncbi:MAG: hypothetical protein E7031_03500 [Akkermansiaceae bacterium]|nr:hypothetical protein [Akkermansiaceae bacterium]